MKQNSASESKESLLLIALACFLVLVAILAISNNEAIDRLAEFVYHLLLPSRVFISVLAGSIFLLFISDFFTKRAREAWWITILSSFMFAVFFGVLLRLQLRMENLQIAISKLGVWFPIYTGMGLTLLVGLIAVRKIKPHLNKIGQEGLFLTVVGAWVILNLLLFPDLVAKIDLFLKP